MDSSPAPPLVTWFLVPPDLFVGPIDPVLAAAVDPLLETPIPLSKKQVNELTAFVPEAWFDERVRSFFELIPATVPSGLPVAQFEGCEDGP